MLPKALIQEASNIMAARSVAVSHSIPSLHHLVEATHHSRGSHTAVAVAVVVGGTVADAAVADLAAAAVIAVAVAADTAAAEGTKNTIVYRINI